MIARFGKFSSILCLVSLFIVLAATCQTNEKRPNYPDEIIPVKGKPFKGRILKFEGTKLYVEITRHKVAQIITIDVDSLLEVTKDFGPTKIAVWKRKPETQHASSAATSPTIKLPQHLGTALKRDTAAAFAVERDSIYVGAVDRQDTAVGRGAVVDQKPVPLVRANTEYPPGAVSKRMEGIVKLRLWIDREGIPRKYVLVECTDPIFVETSVVSAMKWEFSPAVVKGTPVGVWASISFEYRYQR